MEFQADMSASKAGINLVILKCRNLCTFLLEFYIYINFKIFFAGFLADKGSSITSLDVSFCERVGDHTLVHISRGLSHLKCLSLCACNVSDEGVAQLARSLKDLRTLNIGQCHRITDRSLASISENMRNLESIDLYGCTKITTVGLEKIMQLRSLSTLNLGLWHKR